MSSDDFSKEFYIGRTVDPESGKSTESAQVYDPDDLTTHAVVVGMTGSGKTGLCLDLMEEAALKNLPAILIDPKGDLTNLLLHFPELLPEDFKPWINADDARRDGVSIEQAATDTATMWSEGLQSWNIQPERIQRLKDSVDRTIFTPGSTAGKPISILASLKVPDIDWQTNQEVLLEQVEGTVTALLILAGFNDIDPIADPEHILLAKIIADAWAVGKDVDIGDLIMQTQKPPFKKLGFFSVDEFFPKKKRMALAMKLNSIVAAPTFQPWITGDPLDIQSLMYSVDGKPRHSIFYIAHLSETERMFFVTLLYSAVETWMRSQSGTTSLRALVYFDEIFGYLPPTANPPSKVPMLRMLKQARAFGVGMVLATQNPVDIDYKGLSNAGTWFIGRLQTERDKERLLDGLQGANGSEFDRRTAEDMLSNLGKRQFLVHNVHDRGGPGLFQTRWAMNYMAGPMTRNQIPALNKLAGSALESGKKTTQDSKDSAKDSAKQSTAQATRATVSKKKPPAVLQRYSTHKPEVGSGLGEVFLPRAYSFSRAVQQLATPVPPDQAEVLGLVYLPGLFMQANVLYTDRKGSYSERRRYAVFIADPKKNSLINYKNYQADVIDVEDLDLVPEENAFYDTIDTDLQSSRKVSPLRKKYIDYIYREAVLPLYANETLKLLSTPDEPKTHFLQRCNDAADDKEDLEIEKLQASYDKQVDRLKTKIRREIRDLEKDETTLQALKMETLVNYGAALANLAGSFLGGRRRRTRMRSTFTKQRQKQNAEADIRESHEELAILRSDLDELSREHERELFEIDKKWAGKAAQVETVNISPLKKNIDLELIAVAWQPNWVVKIKGRSRVIPAA